MIIFYKMTIDWAELGSKIHALRVKRKLKLEHVAEKAGLSRAMIGHLESGARDSVRVSTLEAVARALECDLVIDFLPRQAPDPDLHILEAIRLLSAEDRQRVVSLLWVLGQPRDAAREMLAQTIDMQVGFLTRAASPVLMVHEPLKK